MQRDAQNPSSPSFWLCTDTAYSQGKLLINAHASCLEVFGPKGFHGAPDPRALRGPQSMAQVCQLEPYTSVGPLPTQKVRKGRKW